MSPDKPRTRAIRRRGTPLLHLSLIRQAKACILGVIVTQYAKSRTTYRAVSKLFISHSSADKERIRQLALDLKLLGHEAWLDEWNISVGQHITSEIERAIESSQFVIIALSRASVSSSWVEREWKSAFWDEVNNRSIIILPILLEDCRIPTLIRDKKYADFRKSYALGFHELATALRLYSSPEDVVSLRFEYPALEEEFPLAQGISVIGADLGEGLLRYYSLIENALSRGGSVRVILCEPEQHTLRLLAFRSYMARRPDLISDSITRTLEYLKNLQAVGPGKLEVRTLAFPPPFGMFCSTREAWVTMHLKIMPFRVATGQYPVISLSGPPEAKWISFFLNQYELFWNASRATTYGHEAPP
jgi:hypothetical protein